MRKQLHRKHTHASVPMLVNRLLEEHVESLEEHSMVMAFQYGVATKQHYDYLVRMANMMNIATQTKPSESALGMVQEINALAQSIFNRYTEHSKFGVAGLELDQMRHIVRAYDDYWKRQTTNLYNQCVAELKAFYADLENNKAELNGSKVS